MCDDWVGYPVGDLDDCSVVGINEEPDTTINTGSVQYIYVIENAQSSLIYFSSIIK